MTNAELVLGLERIAETSIRLLRAVNEAIEMMEQGKSRKKKKVKRGRPKKS